MFDTKDSPLSLAERDAWRGQLLHQDEWERVGRGEGARSDGWSAGGGYGAGFALEKCLQKRTAKHRMSINYNLTSDDGDDAVTTCVVCGRNVHIDCWFGANGH